MKIKFGRRLKRLSVAFALVSLPQVDEPPTLIVPDRALYKLFREHLLTGWPMVTPSTPRLTLQGIIDPIPLYMIKEECKHRRLLVVPFEGLRFHSKDGQIQDAAEAWRNSQGAPILIYAVNFDGQKFQLLFNGYVVDFHGSVAKARRSLCPDLVVTIFDTSSQELIYSKLVYSEDHDRYEIPLLH